MLLIDLFLFPNSSPFVQNLVLKLWHRCPERGDRVLSFVSLDLPRDAPTEQLTGDYDLVDLSQTSTGRLKVMPSIFTANIIVF